MVRIDTRREGNEVEMRAADAIYAACAKIVPGCVVGVLVISASELPGGGHSEALVIRLLSDPAFRDRNLAAIVGFARERAPEIAGDREAAA